MNLPRVALAPAVLALTVAALATSPSAAAQPEDQFLDELATLNIQLPQRDSAETIAAGYQTCNELRTGTTVLDEMAATEQRYLLPLGQGTLFVSAATTNLCPDFAS